MPEKRLVVCYRYDDEKSRSFYTVHEIPYDPEMTVMNMLDYVTEQLEPTFSHLTHSRCDKGYCGRCVLKINRKAGLACVETTDAEIVIIEPADTTNVSKDLATRP
jgi:succinate dehydrogenase / fumarate reductase iron-sulfur subunit